MTQILTNTDATRSVGHSILYECINTVLGIESEKALDPVQSELLSHTMNLTLYSNLHPNPHPHPLFTHITLTITSSRKVPLCPLILTSHPMPLMSLGRGFWAALL